MPENLQTTAIHQNMECDVETGGKSRDRVKSSEWFHSEPYISHLHLTT